MSKPKVLLLLHDLSLTGAPKVALDAFDCFAERYEIRTLALRSGPLEEYCRRLGPLQTLDAFLNPTRAIDRAKRKARKISVEYAIRFWMPDLIYINSVASLRFFLMLLLPDVPVLLHVHELAGTTEAYISGCEDLLRNRPARYIAVSEAVRQFLVRNYAVDTDKIALIHAFIPDSIGQDLPALQFHKHGTPFVIGGAGLPQMRKGMTLWLQMAAELITLVGKVNVRFVWVGVRDDADSAAFRVMARCLGLEDNVEFVPVTPNPLAHYACFDVFAMTSWEDPCPIVVLESMLLRKPVACFANSGGAPEEVGDTGLIVADFSPRAMALQIAELIGCPDRLAAMGERAHARILDNFVASHQAPEIEEQIRQILN